jgi:heterodisulfide reductase subunit A
MTSALTLADQGFPVHLVEKEAELGGLAKGVYRTLDGSDVQQFLAARIAQVKAHPKITVYTSAEVKKTEGFVGNFTTTLTNGVSVGHGAVVLATGGVEYRPTEYLFGQSSNVITQRDLEKQLFGENLAPKAGERYVMVQCVGSREENAQYCSRVCCQDAVKNAIALKERSPAAEVAILYRDIRTYGLLEEYYTQARKAGVIFIRFDPEAAPQVSAGADGVAVRVKDHVLLRDIEIEADRLVLSAGMVAADTSEVSALMKLNRNPEGFFIEAHVKLRPVDMPSEGVFLCGTAHGPKLISETIAQAQAAAARASTLLSKDSIKLSAITAKVETEQCVKCLTCVRSCPFGVPQFNQQEKVIEINEALCRGCGVCTAVCPRQTINLSFYEDDQIVCKIEALLNEEVA